MRKEIKRILCLTAAGCMLAGCNASSSVEETQISEVAVSDNDIQTTAQVYDDVDDVIEAIITSSTVEEAEEILKANIDGYERVDSTEIVNAFSYLIYTSVHTDTVLGDDEVEKILTGWNGSKIIFDEIQDEDIKSDISWIYENHGTIVYVNGEVYPDIDYKYITDNYGSYLRDDYLALMNFYADERSISFVDPSTRTLNGNIIVTRLLTLEDDINKFSDSSMLSYFQESYDMYLQVLLGSPGYDFLGCIFDDDATLSESTIELYKDIAENCASKNITSKVQTLLDAYEETNYSRTTDIEVLILTLSNTDTEDSVYDPDGNLIDTSGND